MINHILVAVTTLSIVLYCQHFSIVVYD